MSGIKGRLARGAIWLAASRILVNLISFASTLLIARLLVPADFGLVAMGTIITTIITSVTELSMSSALVQHANPERGHFDSAFTLNLGRALLITLIIALIAVPVSRLYGDSRLIGILLATSGVTFVSGLLNPQLAVLSRNLVFWQEFVISVSQKLAGAVASIAVALIWHSYWALIVGNMTLQLSAVILSYVLIPYRPRLRLREFRELLSFSVWLTLAQAVNTINWKSDQLAIGFLLGNTSLGFYTLGDTLAALPTREATAPIAQTLFPGFARLTHDLPRLRRAYQRGQAFLCAVALPVGCGFALIAKPLILLTMGAAWAPAIIVIQLLSSLFALQTLASTLQPVAMALGDTRGLFWRDVLNLLIRLPLVGLGYAAGGFVGILWGRCISSVIGTVINMLFVRRLLDLSLGAQLAVNTRSLIGVVTMVAVMMLVEQLLMTDAQGKAGLVLQIAILVMTGAVTYIGVLYVLWQSMGAPEGPEHEVADIVAKLRR